MALPPDCGPYAERAPQPSLDGEIDEKKGGSSRENRGLAVSKKEAKGPDLRLRRGLPLLPGGSEGKTTGVLLQGHRNGTVLPAKVDATGDHSGNGRQGQRGDHPAHEPLEEEGRSQGGLENVE